MGKIIRRGRLTQTSYRRSANIDSIVIGYKIIDIIGDTHSKIGPSAHPIQTPREESPKGVIGRAYRARIIAINTDITA
jgi:hypothetical protein